MLIQRIPKIPYTMTFSIQTVRAEDREFVRSVAQAVFSAYDGRGRNWRPDSASGIWPIHMADRAGVVGVECAGRRVCVKLFYDRSLKGRMRNLFRFSKAKRAWRCGVKLMERGIPVPATVGYAETRGGMGLMITALVEDAIRLDVWIRQNGFSEPTAKALGQFVRRLHDVGVAHKDLSPRNILIRAGGDCRLLDYEDARFFHDVSRRRRLCDLHHLYERSVSIVPRNSWRIFLESYLGNSDETDSWCQSLEYMVREKPSKYTKGLDQWQNG